MTPKYEYKAKIARWVDGDTVYLEVDLGFHMWTHQSFRLVGPNGEYFDAPEVRGEEREQGLIIKERLEQFLPAGTEVVVRTFKPDKYGRWLAWIPGVIEEATR